MLIGAPPDRQAATAASPEHERQPDHREPPHEGHDHGQAVEVALHHRGAHGTRPHPLGPMAPPPMPPPNMSDRPPPLPLCSSTRTINSNEAVTLRAATTAVSTDPG